MSLYNHYLEYLKELTPDAETWVPEQIANELLSRDNSVKFLRARIAELKKENAKLKDLWFKDADPNETEYGKEYRGEE